MSAAPVSIIDVIRENHGQIRRLRDELTVAIAAGNSDRIKTLWTTWSRKVAIFALAHVKVLDPLLRSLYVLKGCPFIGLALGMKRLEDLAFDSVEGKDLVVRELGDMEKEMKIEENTTLVTLTYCSPSVLAEVGQNMALVQEDTSATQADVSATELLRRMGQERDKQEFAAKRVEFETALQPALAPTIAACQCAFCTYVCQPPAVLGIRPRPNCTQFFLDHPDRFVFKRDEEEDGDWVAHRVMSDDLGAWLVQVNCHFPRDYNETDYEIQIHVDTPFATDDISKRTFCYFSEDPDGLEAVSYEYDFFADQAQFEIGNDDDVMEEFWDRIFLDRAPPAEDEMDHEDSPASVPV